MTFNVPRDSYHGHAAMEPQLSVITVGADT